MDNSHKKWSVGYVGQFAMKFLCMGKVFYSDLFWRKKNKILNCTIVSSSHCHSRQMVQTFLRSQTEHKKRAFQSQEVAITTSNTCLRRHLFSSTTCKKWVLCRNPWKEGSPNWFTLIYTHITEQFVFFTLILLSSLCSHFTTLINPQTSRRFEIPQWSLIGSHWSSWIQRIPRIPLPLSMVGSQEYHKLLFGYLFSQKKILRESHRNSKKVHVCGALA